MLAKQDEFINEASATIYQLSQEEQIRLQCEAREDYYRRQRTIQYNLDRQKDTIESQNITIKQLTDKAISQQEKIVSLENKTISLQEEVASLKEMLSDILGSADLSNN